MTSEEFSAGQLASIIDHTLLAPESTAAEIVTFLRDAEPLKVRRVCVLPTFVRLAREESDFEVVSVVGFPNGAHESRVKILETELALDAGAAEIDVVANLANIRSGGFAAFEAELRGIRSTTSEHALKVILETACLTDDEIIQACTVARDAGFDFVKTSTGFHPAGGASVHAVKLMAATVGNDLGVKASGGIRSAHDARALLDAGATRLGLSATATVLAEWSGNTAVTASQSAGY